VASAHLDTFITVDAISWKNSLCRSCSSI